MSSSISKPFGGPIDLHFHGAFGVDFMDANNSRLNALSYQLGERGLAGFCATTLSVQEAPLADAVTRLGAWIHKIHECIRNEKRPRGALPLGIHLEGPFLSPEARGAHPPGAIRPLRLTELDHLWELSHHTLKILTAAPEPLSAQEMSRLARWCRDRKIHLSLGHSRATESQAEAAFEAGFSGITHAWNALSFHHREPGALGAALGRKNVALEIILDQIHVHPTVIRWTHQLHSNEPICWISDGAPAAGLAEGERARFGPLEIQQRKGACHLLSPQGGLAGGGLLLPDCFARFVEDEAKRLGRPALSLIPHFIPFVTTFPQKVLKIPPRSPLGRALARRTVRWAFEPSGSKRSKGGSPRQLQAVAQFL